MDRGSKRNHFFPIQIVAVVVAHRRNLFQIVAVVAHRRNPFQIVAAVAHRRNLFQILAVVVAHRRNPKSYKKDLKCFAVFD